MRLLIVEDEEKTAAYLKKGLSESGFVVDHANDGEEGVFLASQTSYDLIILDVMMPKLDGYQTCALVKHNQDFKDIPIIMLSSKDGVYDKAKARVVGANDFISKPFTSEDLINAIKNIK